MITRFAKNQNAASSCRPASLLLSNLGPQILWESADGHIFLPRRVPRKPTGTSVVVLCVCSRVFVCGLGLTSSTSAPP